MKVAALALFMALVAPTECLSLTTASPRSPALSIRRRPVFMAEETTPARAKDEEPTSFTPPPAEKKQDFDLSQYSMTLSIFVSFVLVKSLAYFGIMDVD
mmetsp:Transcript_11259/g.37264  ORF Transcript_11259/g.37264 Transcript_11259/m.37264 type:complete len:99 (+) Transcript_11259:23-319(+)|eukprot:scaffold2201_cov110-Isochrysis_galbana.AAC.5